MNLTSTSLVAGGLSAIFALAAAAPSQVRVDDDLPRYRPVQGVSGSIKSVGSDTMNNLMTLWAEKFKEMYPNVSVEIEGKGSSTAPPALIERSANFGPMSRPMKDSEIDEFESEYGYKPSHVRAAIDMLAVYVHKDNPIAREGLTMAQVDAIFSKTRKLGHPDDVTTWGDLGLQGVWADKPISLYGRNSASGTYGYFKTNALGKGDYKDSVKEQPGSASVVSSVANDKYAIGYSGIGYRTADVAVVPLATGAKAEPIEASYERVSEYPLARFLHVYVDHQPGTELDPLRREFLRLVFSREGQSVVIKDGYLPVTFAIAERDLGALGIDLEPAGGA